MPNTFSLGFGIPTVLVQNIPYALPPNKASFISSSAAIEQSLNGSTGWTALPNGATGAAFIRSITPNNTVLCKDAGNTAVVPPPINFNAIQSSMVPAVGNSYNLGARDYEWVGVEVYRMVSIREGVLRIDEVTFGLLTTSLQPYVVMGTLAGISDSTVNTPGSTVAGGGANHVLARWNGTVWKVVA
jgi:hypothetical protein